MPQPMSATYAIREVNVVIDLRQHGAFRVFISHLKNHTLGKQRSIGVAI
jgi:hypothetical protein